MPTPERPARITALTVTLTPTDRATLQALLRSSRCPYGLHKRARAVLLLAAGMPITEIARRVDLERRHVYRWVARFQAQGVDGLKDTERPGPVRRGLADMLEREGET
jgi:CRP-like cAMP-binding protein